MLRIHFTGADLVKTRFATSPDPLWELSLSMHQLRLANTHPLLRGWKREVNAQLEPTGKLRAEVALVLAVNPARGYFPDFLTPYEADKGFEAGVQTVLSTPKARLRNEIGLLARPGAGTASTAEGLRRGSVPALHALGHAMRQYHRAALEPVWGRVTAAVEADRNRRTRQLTEGGLAEALNGLHPQARFADSILSVGSWGRRADEDLHLDGRGLLLVPSYFKETHQLMVLADTALPPVLVYPVDRGIRLTVDARHASLGALLGGTRAVVLELAAAGGTTSEIAQRARVSVAAASKHLSVLREAALVLSTRDQNRVFHTLTPLGRALLKGA